MFFFVTYGFFPRPKMSTASTICTWVSIFYQGCEFTIIPPCGDHFFEVHVSLSRTCFQKIIIKTNNMWNQSRSRIYRDGSPSYGTWEWDVYLWMFEECNKHLKVEMSIDNRSDYYFFMLSNTTYTSHVFTRLCVDPTPSMVAISIIIMRFSVDRHGRNMRLITSTTMSHIHFLFGA